jgi:hypothetical protein
VNENESLFDKFFNDHTENLKLKARLLIHELGPKTVIEIAMEIAQSNEDHAKQSHEKAKTQLADSIQLLKGPI